MNFSVSLSPFSCFNCLHGHISRSHFEHLLGVSWARSAVLGENGWIWRIERVSGKYTLTCLSQVFVSMWRITVASCLSALIPITSLPSWLSLSIILIILVIFTLTVCISSAFLSRKQRQCCQVHSIGFCLFVFGWLVVVVFFFLLQVLQPVVKHCLGWLSCLCIYQCQSHNLLGNRFAFNLYCCYLVEFMMPLVFTKPLILVSHETHDSSCT